MGVAAVKLDYAKIGKRVRRRRNKQSMTQETLAELCDVTPQYISNIERAVSIPSTETIMQLAIALDTTPDEFLVGAVRFDEPGEKWRGVAEQLRTLTPRQLELAAQLIEVAARQKPEE